MKRFKVLELPGENMTPRVVGEFQEYKEAMTLACKYGQYSDFKYVVKPINLEVVDSNVVTTLLRDKQWK